MSELPYFKFMVGDWLAGKIQGHDMETQGIFINVCARAWKNGGAIQDGEKLARLLHIDKQKLANAIQVLTDDGCLIETEGGSLSSKFILLQLRKQAQLSSKRASAGRKGGQAKQLARRSKCQANEKQTPSILESESDKDIPPKSPKGGMYSDEFERFWEAYPKKKDKRRAFKAFQRAKTRISPAEMMYDLERQKTWEDWLKENGQYIPNPATWLNGDRSASQRKEITVKTVQG